MINLKEMLTEDRSAASVSRGCLMAMVPEDIAKTIVEFGKKIIPDEDLYIKDGEFGRETETHVTVRYGFTKDLTELEIRSAIDNQPAFTVNFFKLDKFESDEFDVIILRCESPIIQKWYELLGVYPNEETFSDYKQHMTIAYVKKGTFSHTKDIDLNVPITEVCYSPIQGGKSNFELKRMPSLYDDLQENIDAMEDLTESISDQQLASLRLDKKSIDLRDKRIQDWLNTKITNAPGKTRDEKVQWVWANDPTFGKVVNALQNLSKNRPRIHTDTHKAQFQADKYYIRFGDIPKNNKSMNWLARRHEKGVSVYSAKWNTKHNMWEIIMDDLSEIGMATLDSLVYDFSEGKGRPIYLLHGQETRESGVDDTEPLIDPSQVKIVKKLNPEEVWIEYYGETIAGTMNESVNSIDLQINNLEKEWERLDSMGNNSIRQNEISVELEKLRKKKEDSIPNYPKTKQLWADLHASLNENAGGHTSEDFMKLGDLQRAKPESAMLKVQHIMSGGVLNPVVEHAGDIMHRMNDRNTFDYAGYPYVLEKVDRVLWYLKNPYGFSREMWENIKTNKTDVTKLNKALLFYAHEHNKIPVFNEAQKVARDLCVYIGNHEWDKAISCLEILKKHLKNWQEWKKFAHEGLVE